MVEFGWVGFGVGWVWLGIGWVWELVGFGLGWFGWLGIVGFHRIEFGLV